MVRNWLETQTVSFVEIKEKLHFLFYWGRNYKNIVHFVLLCIQNSAESWTVHFIAFHRDDLFHNCDLLWRKVSEVSIFIDGAMKTKSSCGCSSNDCKNETNIHCWKIVDCCWLLLIAEKKSIKLKQNSLLKYHFSLTRII